MLIKNVILYFLLAISLLTESCNDNIENKSHEEWASLFNGKDLTGWDIKIKIILWETTIKILFALKTV